MYVGLSIRNIVVSLQFFLMLLILKRSTNSFFFFFFMQKTAYEIRNCDWSSDVCSPDLTPHLKARLVLLTHYHREQMASST